MTNFTDADGNRIPCTVISAGPCSVIQVKTEETDGYNAVQLAYGETKLENINKSTRGHLKKVGDQGFKSFGEFHVTSPEDYKLEIGRAHV